MSHELAALGWSPSRAEEFIPHAAAGCVPARVAAQHRGGYVVYSGSGERPAEVAGQLRHASLGSADLPAVGDWVAVRDAPDADAATIHALLPRRTVFSRKAAGEAVEQVLAANVDVVFLVSALDGDLNPRRIERYLGLAWGSGAAPVIVLNKADLCPDIPSAVDRVAAVAPGVAIHVVSALSGTGLEALGDAFLSSRTVALLGSSGVGKSSLINLLVGREAQRIHDVRGDGKGRHTTTRRELILRPEGGLVIDTPGMRELRLWEGGEGVPAAFAEVEDFAARCRFTDCSHDAEPSCAVLDAVADGTLAPERLASYRKLRGEVRHLEARQDQRARDDQKRREKALHRALYKRLDQKRRG